MATDKPERPYAIVGQGTIFDGLPTGQRWSASYLGSTVVILILVSLMPPNRSDRWLGGTESR